MAMALQDFIEMTRAVDPWYDAALRAGTAPPIVLRWAEDIEDVQQRLPHCMAWANPFCSENLTAYFWRKWFCEPGSPEETPGDCFANHRLRRTWLHEYSHFHDKVGKLVSFCPDFHPHRHAFWSALQVLEQRAARLGYLDSAKPTADEIIQDQAFLYSIKRTDPQLLAPPPESSHVKVGADNRGADCIAEISDAHHFFRNMALADVLGFLDFYGEPTACTAPDISPRGLHRWTRERWITLGTSGDMKGRVLVIPQGDDHLPDNWRLRQAAIVPQSWLLWEGEE